MTDPRVLIVGNFLSAQGAARGVCEELAPRLQASGWTTLTTSSRPSRPARLADMMWTVWSRRDEYDVAQVDVYSGPAFFWAESVCWMLRRVGRPYILTLHGGGLPDFARAKRERVLGLLNSAAAVTVPSPYLLDKMRAYRSDLILMPNALQISAYRSPGPHLVQPNIFWLRAFHELYNPCMAVRVVARLKEEFPSIHLTMVGPDKGDSTLEKTVALAKTLELGSHVEIRGPVPKAEVPGLLSGGDIFLNTSNVDNTPVTVLEAMASGMCVVSTEVAGIPYLLKSGQDALLVPVNDDAAMAAAVRRLLTDEALAGRIQAASANKIRAFDWNELLPRWKELFLSVKRKISSGSYSSALSDLTSTS